MIAVVRLSDLAHQREAVRRRPSSKRSVLGNLGGAVPAPRFQPHGVGRCHSHSAFSRSNSSPRQERIVEAIACRDQEIDVHHAPEQPAQEVGELDPAELHHRGLAADGGEIAQVAIMKWGW
jgi:hypothetical protein